MTAEGRGPDNLRTHFYPWIKFKIIVWRSFCHIVPLMYIHELQKQKQKKKKRQKNPKKLEDLGLFITVQHFYLLISICSQRSNSRTFYYWHLHLVTSLVRRRPIFNSWYHGTLSETYRAHQFPGFYMLGTLLVNPFFRFL